MMHTCIFTDIYLCILSETLSSTHHVNTLLAEGRRIIVGTHDGLVAIFDTESKHLLACYNWHEDKVRSLLVLPEQIRKSICAEVDINSKEDDSGETLATNTQPANSQYIPNTLNDGPLIASIGNGRHRLSTSRRSYGISRPQTRATRADQDITLLLWHS